MPPSSSVVDVERLNCVNRLDIEPINVLGRYRVNWGSTEEGGCRWCTFIHGNFQTRGPLAISGNARRQNLSSPEAFRSSSTEYAVLTSGMCDVHGVHSRKCNAIPADV